MPRSQDITLTASQQKEINKMLKCGIYKEMHAKGLLSDTQLDALLERVSRIDTSTVENNPPDKGSR